MNINKIAIIGVGGTGSMLLTALAPAYDLILFDGDEFEDKNITRQIFSTTGENKATALAGFFNRGPKEVVARPEMIIGTEDIEGADLIISCVDNNKGRKASKDLAMEHDVPLIICGNESWEPMSWLFMPGWDGTILDPFIRHKLAELNDGRQETCAGVEIIAEIPQLPQANYVAGSFALCIMQSLMTCKKEDNYVAEVVATPNPFYRTKKQLLAKNESA